MVQQSIQNFQRKILDKESEEKIFQSMSAQKDAKIHELEEALRKKDQQVSGFL